MKILIQNRITPDRYEKVKSLMVTLGDPSIDCIQISENYFYALEGSHRLTAAKELGYEPQLNILTDLECPEDDDMLYRVSLDVKAREGKGLVLEFND